MPAGLLMGPWKAGLANSTSRPHLRVDSGWQMTVACGLLTGVTRGPRLRCVCVICCRHDDEAQSHFCSRSAYGKARLEAGCSSDASGGKGYASVGASARQPMRLPGGLGSGLIVCGVLRGCVLRGCVLWTHSTHGCEGVYCGLNLLRRIVSVCNTVCAARVKLVAQARGFLWQGGVFSGC